MRRTDHLELIQRERRDIADSYDEELELELDDRDLGAESLLPQASRSREEKSAGHKYFRELFRLQAELVDLQDWVFYTDK